MLHSACHPQPRFAPPAQIADQAWVARGRSPEHGRRHGRFLQKCFDPLQLGGPVQRVATPAPARTGGRDMVLVPKLAIGASAGLGASIDGDDILVDGTDAAARLRDGIYVLRMDDSLIVKRIAGAPGPGHLSVISDNPDYQSWDDLPMAAVQLVGRVVWTGGRVR